MNYPRIAFVAASTLLASYNISNAAQRGSLELIDNLTACAGRLAGTKGFESYVDGLSTSRLSSMGALEYLLGDGRIRPDRRQAINDFRDEFEQQLMSSPAKAKKLVASLHAECMQYVYDAEDVRLAEVEADKEEKRQIRKAELEEKRRLESEERREIAKINADLAKDNNRTELEKTKIHSQTTLGVVDKAADVENARTQANVEIAGKNAEVEINKTNADVDIAKINADANVQIVGKVAEVENGKTRASVEKSQINANAAVAIAEKAGDIELAKKKADVETAKINADAVVDISENAAKVATDRNTAAVQIAQIQADANVEAMKSIVAADGKSRDEQSVAGERFVIDGKIATIKEIGLGFDANACPTALQAVAISKRFAGKNAPPSVVNTCVFGEPLDETTVFYDAEAQYVVRVQRDIWVNSTEVDVDDVMAKARQFYGESAVPADNGRSLVYVANNQASSKPTYGLKIRKYLCDQKECKTKDGNNVLLTFNLIDIPGFAKAVKDGAQAQEQAQGENTKEVRF